VDVDHVRFNLKDGIADLEFVGAAQGYLDHLKAGGLLVDYRITRCKLGLAPSNLREWHITLDFENMNQLDGAFARVSSRADPVEGFITRSIPRCATSFCALPRLPRPAAGAGTREALAR
jgi:hypothetical protein